MGIIHIFEKAVPVGYLTSPGSRLYFVCMISSLIFGFVFYCYQFKFKFLKKFLPYFFNHKVLFHPSSRTDFYLFIFNFWIKTIIVIPFLFSEVKIIYFIQNSLVTIFPNYKPIALNPLIYSILFTFIFFLIADFSRFYLHHLLHKVSFLWEIHKVHHSATVMTPLTLFRAHPIESILSLIRQIIIVGLIAGIFSFLFAGKYQLITIFGVQIIGFLFNFFASNLRHSHIPLSFGFTLESFLISPLMHQIHHSVNENKNNKNLGSCLAIWDILFDSYLRPDFKPLRFGLSTSQRKKRLINYFLNPLAYFQNKS